MNSSAYRRIPCIPENAPFNAEQRLWLNGFLAGLFSNAAEGSFSSAPATPSTPLLVLYGSQTGTAEQVARRFAKQAQTKGFAAKVLEMSKHAEVNWKEETKAVLVTSTWGDGDPPDNALPFWNWLTSAESPKFPGLRYAVLALGDKNYPSFCGAGKKFDVRLAELGAERLTPMAECDIDYETTFSQWMDSVLPVLSGGSVETNGATHAPVSTEVPATSPSKYSRQSPFSARLLKSVPLNGSGSAKETRHIEISLAGSDLDYQPGDVLGIWPRNREELVVEILTATGFNASTTFNHEGLTTPLCVALSEKLQITQPSKDLIEFITKNGKEGPLIQAPVADHAAYLAGREVIDLMEDHPGIPWTPELLTTLLRKLQPRLYSISSSHRVHPGEVHLTVGVVSYQTQGRERYGVCSNFLASGLNEGDQLPIFFQSHGGFRLPQDTDKPVIMVGPGTGIAPFRAFLEEREATGAKGKNWLFFGDQHAATDFLYRERLESWVGSGLLTRLDTAFSRDQAAKIYVQNRMEENAAEMWKWLEEGAYFYVCGDAKRMAKDVEAALLNVISAEGGKSADQAREYLQKLQSEKRYLKDVY